MKSKTQYRYVALLRGINVGGNNMIKMSDLVASMTDDGFENVKSYMNSGNIMFTAAPAEDLTKKIEGSIKRHSGLDIEVAVFSDKRWQAIVDNAPKSWGNKDEWKHNVVVMIPPATPDQMLESIGELRPEYESVDVGDGVLYQSISRKYFGRARSGALVGKPIYKKMTIRNYNTAIKLRNLLTTDE